MANTRQVALVLVWSLTKLVWTRQMPFVDDLPASDNHSTFGNFFDSDNVTLDAPEIREVEVTDSNVEGDQEHLHATVDDHAPPDLEPVLVPLRREMVPIRRLGKIVTYKTSYSGLVSVGVPAQEFRVVFDTGSGNVVVPDARCKSESCLIHKTYNLSNSETGAAINQHGRRLRPWELPETVTLGFGTGVVKGQLAEDHVCLSPASNESVHRKGCLKMDVLMASEMTDSPFLDLIFDGIVGLSLQALALTERSSFYNLLSRSGQVGASQFAFFLTENEDDEESELAIGGMNPLRTLTPPAWSPVLFADEGHWLVAIKAVRIDGEPLEICKDGSCRAVVDTGSSHLGVPAAQIDALHDALVRDAGDFLDCRLAESSVLEFEMESMNLSLSAVNYMRRIPLREGVDVGKTVINEDLENAAGNLTVDETDVDMNATKIVRHCGPRLMSVDMPAPMGPNLWIFGEPLVQKYYTVYDWAKLQIGFGLANSRRNTMPLEKGPGSLPKDLAAEGHLLLQGANSHGRQDAGAGERPGSLPKDLAAEGHLLLQGANSHGRQGAGAGENCEAKRVHAEGYQLLQKVSRNSLARDL